MQTEQRIKWSLRKGKQKWPTRTTTGRQRKYTRLQRWTRVYEQKLQVPPYMGWWMGDPIRVGLTKEKERLSIQSGYVVYEGKMIWFWTVQVEKINVFDKWQNLWYEWTNMIVAFSLIIIIH